VGPFLDKLRKTLDEKPVAIWTPRPEVLLLPQIPKPMHGLAPRVILGDKWWNETRRAAYNKTDNHCIACGVHKTRAKGPKWMEAHEVYRTNYLQGRMVFLEAVPLCHYCHNFIHSGRLQALLDKHRITQQRFTSIIQHGERVLGQAGLEKAPPYEGKIAPWSSWRLVLNRKMYKPRFKSAEAWAKHFGVELEE